MYRIIASRAGAAESTRRTASISPARTPIPRRGGADAASADTAPRTAPVATPSARAAAIRATRSPRAAPSHRASSPRRCPAASGRVSTTFTPGAKRSVSESHAGRTALSQRRPTPPNPLAEPRRHRTGSPARTTRSSGTAARRSARSAASQSKMLPQSAVNASDATPPRKRQRQSPDARDDRDATRLVRSHDDRLALVAATAARLDARPSSLRAASTRHATGGRLSHTTPRKRRRERRRRCGRRIPLAVRRRRDDQRERARASRARGGAEGRRVAVDDRDRRVAHAPVAPPPRGRA